MWSLTEATTRIKRNLLLICLINNVTSQTSKNSQRGIKDPIQSQRIQINQINQIYLSDMVAMVLNACNNPRSALPLRFCHLPREFDRKSPEEPFVFAMTVVRALSARSGFVGPPTRFGSLLDDSLAKVRHSEVSSMECDSRTRPHSEQRVSPAEWSTTSSVSFLQSVQYASDMIAGRGRKNPNWS